MTVTDVRDLINALAPPELAEDGDRIGLQVGDPAAAVNRILVALDVTSTALDRAESVEADLLVVHHPLIFHPLIHVRSDHPVGQLLTRIIQNRWNLIVAHTNLDNATNGVGRALAERLGVSHCRSLQPKTEAAFKVAVFVPPQSMDAVADAMASAGAGVIGNYTHCSFRAAGVGTFLPMPGAVPTVGEVGKAEQVNEFRLEMMVPQSKLQSVVASMIEAHPYDEVAYDVYRLANEARGGGALWLGEWESTPSLAQAAERVAEALCCSHVRFVGDEKRSIRVVAVCPGSGKSFIEAAANAGAELLITGDVDYHTAREAQQRGLCLMDAGHFATEQVAVDLIASHLRQHLAADLEVLAFYDEDPFRCT